MEPSTGNGGYTNRGPKLTDRRILEQGVAVGRARMKDEQRPRGNRRRQQGPGTGIGQGKEEIYMNRGKNRIGRGLWNHGTGSGEGTVSGQGKQEIRTEALRYPKEGNGIRHWQWAGQ